jgi:hypothetical protein
VWRGGQAVGHTHKVAPFLNRSLRLGKVDFCFSSCLTPGEAPATKALWPATLCISARNVPLRLGSKGHFWHRKHACKGHLYSLRTCAKLCAKPLRSLWDISQKPFLRGDIYVWYSKHYQLSHTQPRYICPSYIYKFDWTIHSKKVMMWILPKPHQKKEKC